MDYLLDVPSLIAAGALAFPGAKSSAGSTAAGALVAVGGSDRVLVASCARSGVPEEIVAMGVDRVSAFDWDVNAIAELAAAKEAAKAAAAAGGAAPSSAVRKWIHLTGSIPVPCEGPTLRRRSLYLPFDRHLIGRPRSPAQRTSWETSSTRSSTRTSRAGSLAAFTQ